MKIKVVKKTHYKSIFNIINPNAYHDKIEILIHNFKYFNKLTNVDPRWTLERCDVIPTYE